MHQGQSASHHLVQAHEFGPICFETVNDVARYQFSGFENQCTSLPCSWRQSQWCGPALRSYRAQHQVLVVFHDRARLDRPVTIVSLHGTHPRQAAEVQIPFSRRVRQRSPAYVGRLAPGHIGAGQRWRRSRAAEQGPTGVVCPPVLDLMGSVVPCHGRGRSLSHCSRRTGRTRLSVRLSKGP